MFDTKKFRQLFTTLSSAFLGSFVTTVTFALIALPVTRADNVLVTEKPKQQPSVMLASSDAELIRSQQKTNVKLEGIKPRMLGEGKTSSPDPNVQYYNVLLRELKLLPSRGQSIEIRAKDNSVQRLLKQQLNDALEIYQTVGQLLNSSELDKTNL